MNKDKNPEKFTPKEAEEQIKYLLSKMQTGNPEPEGSKKKLDFFARISENGLKNLYKFFSTLVIGIDSFVGLVTKKQDKGRNDVIQSSRSPIIFGGWIILIVFGIGGVWASCAPLNSAAVAPGTLISFSNKQIIQHHQGGIIQEISAKQGDAVQAGDPIIKLDETKALGSYEAALSQYRTLLANEDRLTAEIDDTEEITFSEFLLKDKEDPKVKKILDTQIRLYDASYETHHNSIESLKKQVNQLESSISGLESQKKALEGQLAVHNNRVLDMKKLLDKKFANKTQYQDAEMRRNQLISDLSKINSEIDSYKERVHEVKYKLAASENSRLNDLNRNLNEIQANVVKAYEGYKQAKDDLERSIIRSPVNGIINKINYTTIGGVVGQGPVAEVTPVNEELLIEARVKPLNIDSVRPGLIAKIRFSAFKSRISPIFTGKVITLSPDVIVDERNPNDAYYAVRIKIDMEEFNKAAKARNLELYPGMQAEVMIVTGTRTLLRYLLDPLTDQMRRAFREK